MMHTINGYITYEKSAYGEDPVIRFSTYKPNPEYQPATVVVREHSIEVDVQDDFDPRPDQIKNLEAKHKKAQADFEMLCTEIHLQISKLQALEHTP